MFINKIASQKNQRHSLPVGRNHLWTWLTIAASFMTAHLTTLQAADTVYTTTTTATGNWSTTGNWAGGLVADGAGNVALLGANGVTLTLDSARTLGQFKDSQGSARGFAVTASGTIALTMDNTGSAVNTPAGDLNSFIGSTASGSVNFGPSIIIANSDLDLYLNGSTTPTLTIGTLGTSTITATSARTINTLANSGGAAGITINSSIGATGSMITVTNRGTGTRTVTLAGSVGPNATLVQNSATSSLRLSSGANNYTGGTTITLGTLLLGAANAIPSTSSVDVTGTLNLASFSTAINALTGAGIVNNATAGTPTLTVGASNGGGTFSGTIQNTLGTLSLTKSGSGTEILTGANTYSGTTRFNGGVLTAGGAESPGSSGPFGSSAAAGSIVFGGGSLQYAPANLAYDYSSRFSTAASQPVSIDTAGETVTFATALTSSGGSLTKIGNGILTLNATETYSGNTTVNGGTLAVGASGSLAASSTISIGAGGTFDVSALGASATYTLGGSATLKASGTGTTAGTTAAIFQVGSTGILDLGAQPIALTWGGSAVGTDSTHPALVVSQGTLNLNNNSVTIVVPGTALDAGVYTLISAPAITGSPNAVPAFTGGNGLQAGKTGVVSVSGNTVILTVSGSGAALGTWNVNADGNWNTAANWSSNPNVPRAAGDVATLGVGSALRTVTLNTSITNGSIFMTNNNSFVIANGGFPLTLNNSGGGSAITVSGGTQNAIAPAVSLKDNVAITVASNMSLSISGVISNNSAAKTLTISGGTLALSGNNSYGPAAGSVGTTLTVGTLQVGHNNALGTGDLNLSGNSTLQAGAAGLNLPNNMAVALGVTETVDNNGNGLTLGGVLSGSGALNKVGNGTLVLGGANTYGGGTKITAGAASISLDGANPGDPGNLGAVPALPAANNVILNGGDLLGSTTLALHANRGIGIGETSGAVGTNALIDAASGAVFIINGSIASAGNGGANGLTVNSLAPTPGTVALGAANTFSGTTVIANGTLELDNSLALQNSALNYNSGTLNFGTITAATIGSLNGSQNLALQNATPAAVALTIGGNNANMVYGGNLSGLGSLVKAGTGTLILSNANYSGGTAINGGSGSVTIRGGTFGSSATAITVGGNLFLTNNTTTTASAFNLATVGGQTGVGATIGGTVNLTNTATTIGSGGNTAGAMTINSSGNINLGDVKINKDGGGIGAGLVVAGGNVFATSINVGQTGTAARAADLNVTGGTLTIADATQTGKFALHSGAGNGTLTMSGGTLNYLGTDGLLMSIGAGPAVATITGGTATLTGVTLNSGGTATADTLTVNGTNAALYLGSVGLIINAPSATVAATFGNGTIGALADWSSLAPITLTNNPTIKAADAGNVPHNISFGGSLSGAGGFTKTGAGTLILSNANTYIGNTIISNGTLALVADGNISNSAIVAIAAPGTLDVSGATGGTFHLGTTTNQTLQGNGTLTGSLTVDVLGTVAPGFAIGTLTVSGTATLGGTALMEINRAAAPNSDRLVAPTITAGGTLTVTNLGAALHVGDSFQLFSTPVSGTFATLNLPATDIANNVAYTWTNKLALNGTIAVLTASSLVNTNPTSITNTFDGSNLTLSWPTDHIGWRLEAQTNALSTGLGTNWSTVATSASTNRVNVPVNPANGSVFYRLVYP